MTATKGLMEVTRGLMEATRGLMEVTTRGIILGSVGVDAVVRSLDTE